MSGEAAKLFAAHANTESASNLRYKHNSIIVRARLHKKRHRFFAQRNPTFPPDVSGVLPMRADTR